jgi:formylglycine-generating enzyme required for sulfatase activity/outer membrane protein assembly factor BamB
MEIYLHQDGERTGPHSLENVQGWLEGGQLTVSDVAWFEGCEDWVTVQDVPGIMLPGGDHLVEVATLPPFEAYQGDEPYVFISYAHKDAAVVYEEITRLHEAGSNLWYDEGIEASNEWPEEIANAVIHCSVFLVFVSPRSTASVNCRNEINLALNENKPFLAIYLEETGLPPGLRLRMGDLQAILRYKLPVDRYQKKAQDALDQLLGKKPAKARPAIAQQTEAVHEPEPVEQAVQPTAPSKPRRKGLIVALASVLLIACGLLGYLFLGDDDAANGDNPTPGGPKPVEILIENVGTQLWQFQTGGQIWSKPALAPNGMVFFGSKDNAFYAVDSKTGAKAWSISGSDPFCKPAIGGDGRVYVGDEGGKVHAFDFKGKKIWEFKTGKKVVASPTLDGKGNKLFVGSGDGKLYALNASDGTMIWEFYAGADIHVKAALSKEGRLYFGTSGPGAKFFAVGSSDGSKLWEFSTGQTIWSSPAIGRDGTVYFGCHDGTVYSLKGSTGSMIWNHDAQSAVHGPVTLGYDNTLFATTYGGQLLALDSRNGKRKWQFFADGAKIRNAPAVASDNSVYFGAINGKLYAVNGSDGARLWDLQLGSKIQVSSPCITPDGKILIGSHDSKLHCVQGSAPLASDAVWPTYGRDNQRTGLASRASPVGSASFSPGQPWTVPFVDLEMLWCKPGTFMMGSPTSEVGRELDHKGIKRWDETQHGVTLTKGFYLGKYEVTQAQWKKVMGTSPYKFTGDDHPVEEVSWTEAMRFCRELTLTERKAGRLPDGWEYVLPTEAQWEYACRAGTTTVFAFGDSLSSKQANFDGTQPFGGATAGPFLERTTNVGSYAANPWGFYDMHGNVWECCADWHSHYPTGSLTDPTGPASGSARVQRGGSWSNTGTDLRSARRHRRPPGDRPNGLGFRLSLQQVGK